MRSGCALLPTYIHIHISSVGLFDYIVTTVVTDRLDYLIHIRDLIWCVAATSARWFLEYKLVTFRFIAVGRLTYGGFFFHVGMALCT